MGSITILNSSSNIISFTVLYLKKDEFTFTEKFSSFFKTIRAIEFPDDATNITLMIRIEKDNYIPMLATSLHFDTSVTKYYEFVVDTSYKYGLFDINKNKLQNLNFITLSNKTSIKIKSTLYFYIGKEIFSQNNAIIKKNRTSYILIPINAKNITLTVFTFNSLKNTWSLLEMTNFIPLETNKYYEVTSNIFNTSFKLNEVNLNKTYKEIYMK